MASLVERLELLITANAKNAIAGIKETELAAGSLDKTTTGLGQTMSKLGTFAKIGAGAAAVAITAMAFKGVEDFVNLTASVRGYQRILGGTAEENSKLAAQLRVLGVDSEAAIKGFGILAKNIGNGKDTLQQWGVEVAHTRSGNVDLIKTLGNIGDTYKSITDPTQKAAFAAQNFGRGYQALIPFLSKSREELEAFGKEADKNHEIFSQKQLDQGKEYAVTLRELKASMQGLALALGSDLVPLLDTLTGLVTDSVHALDSLGRSLGYGRLSAIAMGAAIGTYLNPGIGTLIGAGIGLIASLHGQSSGIDEVTQAARDLVQLYDQTALSAKDLRLNFQALTQKALDNANATLDSANANTHFGITIGKTGDTTAEGAARIGRLTAGYIAFNKIAHENLGVAAAVIDSLKAQGVETHGYEVALFKLAAKKRDDNALTEEAATKNEYLVTTIDDVQNALLKAAGGQLGYEQALVDVRKAQSELNADIEEFGPFSLEAHDDTLKLEQAQLNLAKATIALSDANADLSARFGGNIDAAQGELDKLRALQFTYPAAKAALDPLVQRIQDYINFINAIPTSKTTTVSLNVSNQGVEYNFDGSIDFDRNPLTPFATGGVVPGPIGGAVPAVVHGGETVFTPDQLRALGNVFGGAGGSITIGQIVTSRPEEVPVEIARRRRVDMWLSAR